MKRIESTFDNLRKQKKKALVAYLVVGDPDLETTLDLMEAVSYTHLTLPTKA